jgi:U3 small nucleolar RNA-associated protein 20
MMAVKLSPVWDDALEAMKQIAETKPGEEAIANLAFDWLQLRSQKWTGNSKPATEPTHQPLTDFECLNFMQLQETAQATGNILSEPAEAILRDFDHAQEKIASRPDNARSKALKVLSTLPGIGEKRSRVLVPYLLSWNNEPDVPIDSLDEELETTQEGGWSLYDRKALISVFAQFTNPKVLYQSERVYQALLALLANGDADIQKSALKAILAWKQEGLKPYQENLEYLLDEARFRNELTVIFRGEQGIQAEHRAELMPVLLRLLYGRTISKKGASSGRQGLHATRLAVIRSLEVQDVGSFLDIALGNLRNVAVVDASGIKEDVLSVELLPVRKQVGLLNMLEAIINEMGTGVSLHMDALVNAVLYILFGACRQLGDDGGDDGEREATSNTSLYRSAKTTALKCVCKLFQNAQSFDWTPYQNSIVAEVIGPRIDNLPAETQGLSWTWRLLSTWSVLPRWAMILSLDDRILPRIVECVGISKAKDEVKIFALSIVRSLVKLHLASPEESEYNELIKSELLDPHIDLIFKQISRLLRNDHDVSRDLLETAVDTVVELAPLVEQSESIQDLVDISTFLLKQPSRKVNPKVKGSLLLVLKQFIAREEVSSNSTLKSNVFDTIAPLFSFFKDRQNRRSLAEVLQVFASHEPSFQEVADLCTNLNAYVERRVDQPDYNKRLSAFTAIAGERETDFTTEHWKPLLHNMVFFIQQDEEFGILATNSADGLCRFIEATKRAWTGTEREAYLSLLSTVVLPQLYSGVREESETVRREHLRVFGSLISSLREWAPVVDLTPLIPTSDEDTDNTFFFHILSPAVSRQLQALRLLEAANEVKEIQSKNISQLFVPLLEHFIFNRPEDGGDDHGLAAQATTTIAKLAPSLEWQQYRAVVRRYITFVQSKPESQKQVIRLVEKMIDALIMSIPDKDHVDSMEVDQTDKPRRLAATAPHRDKLDEEFVASALPTLLEHLHEKDESTVSARVPVGIIIVKLLKLLPSETMGKKLPGVLTDICHILRSKAWESREMARETLSKITLILGPESFGFVLKELRGALTRGYQLHVLSYTLHSILLTVIPEFKQGDLDYCISSIMAVIMDDIFGITGQEKEAEDYSSKVKEVKSSKSQDSMELVAKNASITHLVDLIQPLQSLLLEKLDLRMVRKIESLLTRITTGLLQNPAAESRDTLVFAYEVIQEVYKSQKPEAEPKIDPKLRRYLIQKGAKKSDRGTTSKHTYKLVKFAIDIIRSAMKKYEALRTAANIAGFLPILGDAIVAGEDEVKTAAFKFLTVVAKVPYKADEFLSLYKVAAKETVKSISTCSSNGTDLAQSALKLLSVLLRDRRDIPVKDAAIDMLLGRLKDDLTEPLYRHVTFSFLRSVLDRKIETAVVYDILDHVGSIMITNDDKDTRDLARGAFFQFLREYPQRKNRWASQIAFIVANLKYEREGGRLSVMEVIHLLLVKSSNDFVQEIASTCFVPLIFVLANDEVEKCRLTAGQLIKEIFQRADKERMQKFLVLLRGWVEQTDNPAILRLGLQAFGYYFDGKEAGVKHQQDLELVLRAIMTVLTDQDQESQWELADSALHVVNILMQKYPETLLSENCEDLWKQIQNCLSNPSHTLRLNSIRLLSAYLADFASNASAQVTSTTLKGSHGLQLGQDDIFNLAKSMLGILAAEEVDEALAEETVRVLSFLGSYLQVNTEDVESDSDEDESDGEDQISGSTGRSTVGYLFWKLATVIRKETRPVAQTLIPKIAAMDVLEALCLRSPKEAVLRSGKTILRPLRNLCDPSIRAPFSTDEVFKTRYEALKTKAQSIMELLQRKLGTVDYTQILLAVSERVRERRQHRSSKRKIEAITQPEKYGQHKKKKMEKDKQRRKVKSREQRDMRRGY